MLRKNHCKFKSGYPAKLSFKKLTSDKQKQWKFIIKAFFVKGFQYIYFRKTMIPERMSEMQEGILSHETEGHKQIENKNEFKNQLHDF